MHGARQFGEEAIVNEDGHAIRGMFVPLPPALGLVVDDASGRLAQVVMMETADFRHLDHPPPFG